MTEKEIIKVLKGRHRSLLLQKDTYSSELDKLCLLGRLSLEKIIIISVFLMLHEIESKEFDVDNIKRTFLDLSLWSDIERSDAVQN